MSLLTGEKDKLAALWVSAIGTEKRSGLALLRLLIGNKAPHSEVNIRESDHWLEDGTHLIERNIDDI
jgi:hypothetical protein